MTPKERITSLIVSMGYTVSACSEKADLITTLFYRSDHIYQLECFTGDWDRIWLWGAAHDDDWDHSEAGRSVGILLPLKMHSLDRVADTDFQSHLSEATSKCDAAQIEHNLIRANTSTVLNILRRKEQTFL